MAKTPADAVRRAYRDPKFAKDFLQNPRKYREEYGLTDEAIQVLKDIDISKVIVAAELLSPREVVVAHEDIARAVRKGAKRPQDLAAKRPPRDTPDDGGGVY